jgi:hypothetical protein
MIQLITVEREIINIPQSKEAEYVGNTASPCYRLDDHIVLSGLAFPFREAQVFVISLNDASSSLGCTPVSRPVVTTR